MSQRWWIRLFGAALVAGALALVPYVLTRTDGYVRFRDMQDRLADLERGNDELRQRNAVIKREIYRLKHDLGAVEAVARDELGLVRPGDLVIQLEQRPKVEESQ
jgi:cell division protein FtsB